MKHSHSFIVLPKDCNHRMPQIYGGAFLEQLDMACAVLVERLFINNPSSADHAVTYKIPEIRKHYCVYSFQYSELSHRVKVIRNCEEYLKFYGNI